MKKPLLVLFAVLFFASPGVVPPAVLAAADATCVSDPSSGPVGTTFVITCRGYTPNSYVYAYLVEPGGVAGQLFDQSGAIKIDEQGSISYVQPSFYANAALGTGTWHFVAEELGLAKAVLHRGETAFTITSGTEGVSGAALSADPAVIHKPEQGYVHFNSPGVRFNFQNASEPVTLAGSGFAPHEMVSYWVEPPRGSCSSLTSHQKYDLGIIAPGLGGAYLHADQNIPVYDGMGSVAFDTIKADSAGKVSTQAFFYMTACEGEWHFVARGNFSGKGADTLVTVTGNAVKTDAWLYADPGTVSAMFDRIRFSGSGFGAGERVSCWLRTPQGQVLGFPNLLFFEFSGTTSFQRTSPILADDSGSISFDMVTGGLYSRTKTTEIINGVPTTSDDTNTDAIASEGALGEYAMSCRGDTTGATGIATFTVTGGFVDP